MYTDDILKITEYIEANITGRISLDDLSKLTFISPFHLHRIFTAMTGSTIGSYIRARRLTKSLEDLLESDRNIIDIAIQYNFGSHEAYTRAFEKQFHTTPAEYRTVKLISKAYMQMPINEKYLNYLLNSNKMEEPKIVTKPAFKVIGMETKFSRKNNLIPWLWQQFIPRMGEIENRVGNHSFGICENPNEIMAKDVSEESEYNELVCVEVESTKKVPKGMVAKEFPAHKYAVFTHKGFMNDISKSYDYIYGVWGAKTDYKFADFFDFERYDERFCQDCPDSVMEIWVPIED